MRLGARDRKVSRIQAKGRLANPKPLGISPGKFYFPRIFRKYVLRAKGKPLKIIWKEQFGLIEMLPGIGIFGGGPQINILVSLLKQNGFKVQAVWGRTLQEAQEVAKELDVPFHTNKIDEVLLCKEVDLVFVLCPPNLHAQISVKALGIGKHVICDRPAGLSQSDALKMVKASQYYPTLISLINHSLRFLPVVARLRSELENFQITSVDIAVECESLIGPSDFYDWRSVDIMGGGMLNLIGSHVIDLVTFLTNKRAKRVNGLVETSSYKSEGNGIRQVTAPDFCIFQMLLDDNVLVNATLNSHVSFKSFDYKVTVYGTNKVLVIHNETLTLLSESNESLILFNETQSCEVVGLPPPIIKGLENMIEALSLAFKPGEATWVKEAVRAAASFEDGLYVQAVLSAICQSSRTLQWVPVTVMSEQPDTNALLSAAVRRTAINMA